MYGKIHRSQAMGFCTENYDTDWRQMSNCDKVKVPNAIKWRDVTRFKDRVQKSTVFEVPFAVTWVAKHKHAVKRH